MEVKYTMPDSWQEVTLSQYQEIISIDVEDTTKRMVEIISILADHDPADVSKMQLSSLKAITDHIHWLSKLPTDADYMPIIKINEEEFGLVPRLSDLSLGEWIDLEHYLQDVDKNLHIIMAILYRPLIKAFNDRDRMVEPYDGSTLDARAILFKNHAKMQSVYGALVFFSNIARECMLTMPDYLAEQLMLEIQKTKDSEGNPKKIRMLNFRKKLYKLRSGLGTLSRTGWHMAILQRLNKFLKVTSYFA